ncbi:ATP-binding protein [Poseidonocella sedimentorum]|uniref:histidine kinase n=1 Tax=Poseidonocella sedimentorum TaxID=871652 RepID=A0A1I6DGK2_9RHOB|nr:ATP-binding protein [Poseidonocella sedimentorum]SFR04546.1 two-component system, OmpR family, phosphate regulon sensor histidine kinase PhoR [Poseidonocella sedimentorum]
MRIDDLSTLLSAIPLPTVMVASSERIVNSNRAAEEVFGAKTLGRHYITVFRQPVMLDAIESVLRGEPARTTRYLGHEGEREIVYSAHVAPISIEGEAGVLISFQDLTAQTEAGQMRRDFVANVSHELRTPLTAVLGFIETLQGPARNDEAARERFLDIMQKEASRMNRLVRDLLSLSRVESEERIRPMEPVALGALVTSSIRLLQSAAERAGVTLDFTRPEPDVELNGDTDQLGQVFTNLIENAIKYGGTGERIEIGLATQDYDRDLRGPAAVVTVRDFGPGIDPVHIPRLTERFYRVDTHRSRDLGGTGLGLAIVKHIINRHRGRLRIESGLADEGGGEEARSGDGHGAGSTFIVKLPLSS